MREYKIEHRVMEDFDNIGVSQIQLDETTPDRAQVENTINVSNDGIVSHP